MQERPDPHPQPPKYFRSKTTRTPVNNQREILGPKHVQRQYHFEDCNRHCHSTWHSQCYQRIQKTSPHSYRYHYPPIRRTRYYQLPTTLPQQNRRIFTKVRFIRLETPSLPYQVSFRSSSMFQMQENRTYPSKLPGH